MTGLMVLMVLMERRDPQVMMVLKVYKVPPVHRVPPETMAQTVMTEQ